MTSGGSDLVAFPTAEQRAAARRPLTLVQKWQLAREIVVTYVHARLWLRRQSLEDVLGRLRENAALEPATGMHLLQAARLGRIVRRTLGMLPFDSRCLVQSLVLVSLLARRGIRTTLVIGVKPAPSFQAHAWVELEGYPILPVGGDYGRLHEL